MTDIKAIIFDLDGVIVDTAKYHYIAWKKLAAELGFDFTEKDNERLKGVSRKRSLEIILETGKKKIAEEEKEILMAKKNKWYVEYISKLKEDEIFPGVINYFIKLKKKGIKLAIGSASKNAKKILVRLKILEFFDAVSDGTIISKAKPDPEVFLKAAEMMEVPPDNCLVFEDALAGVEAAKKAGMKCVGVGDPNILTKADKVIKGIYELKVSETDPVGYFQCG
tara:strand:- start:3753 stop:4421 length:669 start_codon:yes stop_codon:yes gene_type:complete